MSLNLVTNVTQQLFSTSVATSSEKHVALACLERSDGLL
jgi:hypothetical protein